MKHHFYSHIVETATISLELGDMDLSQDERVHLISLVESNLHHTIIDVVLSELSEDDKKTFLHHVAHEQHDKVWELLNSKVKNIEVKIKHAAAEVKKELHKDIHEAKSKK